MLLAAAVALAPSAGRGDDEPETAAPPFASEGSIAFHADLASFRSGPSDPGRVEQEVYVAIPNDQLAFRRADDGSGFEGRLAWELVFRTPDGGEAFREEAELTPSAADTLDAADRAILQTVRARAALAPGPYRLEIRVRDLFSEKPGLLDRIRNKRNEGELERWVEVRSHGAGGLGISDPVLVRLARVARDDDPWARSGVDFDPNPSRYYGLVLPSVRLFAEVYAGEDWQEGDAFLVQTQVLDGAGLPLLERATRAEPLAPVFGLTDELFLEQVVPAGTYRLAVTVVHERTRATVRAESPFEVIWSVASWGREPDDILQEMILVMTDAEYHTLERLAPGAREVYLAEFWHGLDPDPTSPDNPLLQDFRSRVAFADREFGTVMRRGILTDRGRVYVRYGPPDDENYQFSSSSFGSVEGALEEVAEPGERATLGSRPSASFLDPDEFREGDVSDLVNQRGSATVKSQQLVVWTYDGRGAPLRRDHQDLTGRSHRGLKFVFADAMGNGDFQLIGSSGTTIR